MNDWLSDEEGALERTMEAAQEQAAAPDIENLSPAEIRWAQEELEEEKGVATDPHYKEFIVKFFAGALAEVLIDYFQHKDKRNRDELIHYTMQILKGALPHLISPQ